MKDKPKDTKVANSKPITQDPLPFKEVIADVLKVKRPPKIETKTGCARG